MVVEARDRVGGRVHTIRFGEGQYAEAGGEWIDTGHRNVRGYLKRFGIPVDDVRRVGPDGAAVAYLNGRRRSYDSLYTSDVERQLGRWYSRVERLSRQLDPLAPWSGPESLDRRSVADLMDEVELSGVGRRLVGQEEIRDDYTVRADELSLLFHLHFARLLWNQSESGSEALRVRGGADRLPRALAERLPVQPGSPVTEVEQSSRGVTAVAGGQAIAADYCVLAAPPPALRQIGLEAPRRVADAIKQVQYGRGTKSLLLYRRSPWRKRGFSGDAFTDLPVGTTWEATSRTLVGYSVGHAGPPPDAAAAQVERVFPGSLELLAESETVTWENERYSGGTYTAFAPGQVTAHWQALRRPFGRIHQAGEHTSLYAGYMEGAIRSGKRVAAAIAEAARR